MALCADPHKIGCANAVLNDGMVCDRCEKETVELEGLLIPDRFHQGVRESSVVRLQPVINERYVNLPPIQVLVTPDGKRYVVDGVQRVEAARRAGMTRMRGVIHHGDLADGARLFRQLNMRQSGEDYYTNTPEDAAKFEQWRNG